MYTLDSLYKICIKLIIRRVGTFFPCKQGTSNIQEMEDEVDCMADAHITSPVSNKFMMNNYIHNPAIIWRSFVL